MNIGRKAGITEKWAFFSLTLRLDKEEQYRPPTSFLQLQVLPYLPCGLLPTFSFCFQSSMPFPSFIYFQSKISLLITASAPLVFNRIMQCLILSISRTLLQLRDLLNNTHAGRIYWTQKMALCVYGELVCVYMLGSITTLWASWWHQGIFTWCVTELDVLLMLTFLWRLHNQSDH